MLFNADLEFQDVAEKVRMNRVQSPNMNANGVKVSPTLGPGLMLIFCALTQFLLLTIIICLLSNSLEKV